MALQPLPAGSSDDGLKTLSDLYNLIGGGGGSTQTTSGGTTTQQIGGSETNGGSASWQDAYTDSSSETVHSSISAEGLNSMLKNILEGTQGLAAVSSGQRGAGGYSSSTNTLLLNDLMARAAGQVAQNDKTTTTNTVRNVSARSGGSVTMSSTTPHTVTIEREPSTVTTAPSNKSNSVSKALLALGLYGKGKSLFDKANAATVQSTGEYMAGGDLGPGMSDQSDRNAAFDGMQTQTELSFGSEFVPGGDLGPGPSNFSEPDSFVQDTWTQLDDPLFMDIPQFVDFPTFDTPDITEDLGASIPDVEYDFDFADGGSVAKRINNVVGFQGNKLVDTKAGMSGREATSTNGPVQLIEPVGSANPTRAPETSRAAQRTPATTANPGHRIIGQADMSQLVDTSATTEDGIVIPEYNITSGGTNRAGNMLNSERANQTGGLDANGRNPDANKAVNLGMNILGAAVPPIGWVQAGSNFVRDPSITSGVSLLNKFAKIPGLNLAVQAINAVNAENNRAEDGSKRETAKRLSIEQDRKYDKSVKEDEDKQSDQARVTINPTKDEEPGDNKPGVNPINPIPTDLDPAPTDVDPVDQEPTTQGSPVPVVNPILEYDMDGNIISNGAVSSGYKAPTVSFDSNNSAGSPSWSTPGPTYAADGGHITGAGTSISDSVPARLSVDEYVLPADVVEAIGIDKLDSIVKKYHTPASIQKLRGGR
jgi:hypothetical protein